MHAHRRLSRLLALAVAIAALLVALPSASAAPLNLKVGAALSLTGDAAAYGISSRRGIDLAVREINAGAIPGIRMSVRTIDDESTVPGAATAYGVFFRDGVAAIMGPTLSSVALDVDPFAQAVRLPVLGISNSQPGVTEVGSFIYRPALTEQFVLPRVVRAVATSSIKPATSVVIQGSDSFSATSAPILSQALTNNGVTVKATETVAAGATNDDYATIANAVVAQDPDVVAIAALATEGVPLLKALRTAGYTRRIIGSNGLNSSVVTKGAGRAATGLIVGTAWAIWNTTTANKRFVKAFRRLYKTSPDQFSATAYAYTYVLATAAVRGNASTAEGVATALGKLTDPKGVPTLLGRFRFDDQRNGRSPVLVQQYRNGRGWRPFSGS